MILKWSDYLKVHPSNKDYNTNASYLQKLISVKETEENSFRLLSDNKTVICIMKSIFNGERQATFYHTIKKASFIQTNPDFFALTGFGERATAVRLDPKELFKKAKKAVVPSFIDMLKCKNVEEVKALTLAKDKVYVDSYAILPPTLSEELFDEENFDPEFIILKIVNKVKLLDAIQRPEKIGLTDEKNANGEIIENIENGEDDVEEVEKHPLEDSFGSIVNFLNNAMMKTKKVEPTALMVCTKPSTSTWGGQQHSLCLKREIGKIERRIQPPPQDVQGRQELADLSHNFGQLTKAMTDKTLLDMRRDAE